MTGSIPADVTVHFRRTVVSVRIEFVANRVNVAPFKVMVGWDVLDEARRQLDKGLTELKDALPGLKAEEADLNDLFMGLHRLGRRILFALFGAQPKIIQGLQSFWNSALPYGRNPGFAPLVECIGDKNAMVPIEILPLFSLNPGPEVASPAEFIRACRALVGFSCIVKRTLRSTPVRGGLRLATTSDGRVPLRFLYFEHLDGAMEELAWFSSVASRHVAVEGPYPLAADDLLSLPEQIFDPGLRLAGGRLAVADQIQHFSCHCYTKSTDPMDSEIELSGSGREVRITLGEIGEEFVSLAARPSCWVGDLPLVFMNACGAARMRAATSFSFPHFFLDHGNRGFIGSEVDMPDDVAAAFSKAFYQRFLLFQLPLGRALLGARNQLLHEFHNPLGIAYSAYADPELHVRLSAEEDSHVGATA